MARIRTIKPEFWTDEAVVSITPYARLLFLGLLNFADDEGYLYESHRTLHLQILPADDVAMKGLLDELVGCGLVNRYETADGKPVVHVRNFAQHQKIDKRSPSKISHNLQPSSNSMNPPDFPRIPPTEGKGMEGKGKEKTASASPSPRFLSGINKQTPSEVAVPAKADQSVKVPQSEADFENFWQQYPRRNGKKLEKRQAVLSWKRLNKSQRGSARNAVAHYADACNRGLTLAKDAHRWLRESAFDDWQTPAVAESPNGRAPDKPGSGASGSTERAPYRDYEPEVVGCEHSADICAECRQRNQQRISALIGEISKEAPA